MGLKVECGQGRTIVGSASHDEGRVKVLLVKVHFGPGMDLDMTWVDDVPGLVSVTIDGVHVSSARYGREELLPLVEGRTEALIKGCSACGSLIDGGEGSSDLCPDELSYRCVLAT